VQCSAHSKSTNAPCTCRDAPTHQVNYAPWKGTVGYSGSLSSQIDPDYQAAAFQYLATATSREIAWQGVLDPNSFSAPLRESMIIGQSAYDVFTSQGYASSQAVDSVHVHCTWACHAQPPHASSLHQQGMGPRLH
jgi:hypothetical protein